VTGEETNQVAGWVPDRPGPNRDKKASERILFRALGRTGAHPMNAAYYRAPGTETPPESDRDGFP
jgi:hypothetical protein